MTQMKLLIIDEDKALYDKIKKSPIARSFAIQFCSIQENIVDYLQGNAINVALINTDENQKKSSLVLEKIKKFDSLIDVLITGKAQSSEDVLHLINKGASDYLKKPLRLEALQTSLDEISKKRNLRRETLRLEKRLESKYVFQGIIGKSPHMLEIYSLIPKISKYFSSVLVTGETGTGKELIARAIHHFSHTANRKFVVCDCVSIPENLFESELFGYTKGAFTGADRDKKGLFEEADKGIIFLDEIGEIPYSTQAKLLRVLEQHQFRPLGSNQTKSVDVRVIAATSRNLREGIKKGTFREDLFHRLNKVEIHLPPLRKRPEDIPLLTRYFLNRYNRKFSKEIKGISRRVQKLFQRYQWPGNIRELENVLESVSILTKKDFIDIQNLPKYLQEYFESLDKIPYIEKQKLSTLEDLEREYIIHVLKLTENNLRKAAKILDISRTTLYNKIKKYFIEYKAPKI